MYQVGDKLVYGVHGVCSVVDLEERVVDRKRQVYLVLEPVGQGGARYLVPTHNAVAMAKLRRMLSRGELEELLDSEEVHTDGWIKDENQRKQKYRDLINSGDRAALVRMVYTLHKHKQAQLASGRKFHLCDENLMKDAIKLLNSEFSLVLNIEQDKVGDYVQNALKIE